MPRLNAKLALPLLAAVTIVALSAFAPTPAAVPSAEAACGAHFSGYWISAEWETCDWDFGCWINPFEPNNINIWHQRWCRYVYDENWYICGMECYDGETRRGCC
jgi:hypothetical protein